MFKNISSSKMQRIVNCPGSVNLCEKFPELLKNDSEEAKKGALLNWLIRVKLQKGVDLHELINKTPFNDQIVDREMIVHVLDYCNIVNSICNGQMGKINQRFKITKGGFVGFSGTPDLIFYNSLSCVLTILNLKYSFTPVAAIKNWQLLSYAWLFNETYPRLSIKFVKMEIYQPRIPTKGGIYKHWEVPFSEIQNKYFRKIKESLLDCQSEYAITKAGDHCHRCPAMLQCDTNLQTCLRIVNIGGVQYGQEPTGEQLANQLKLFRFASDILKKRLQVIESVAEHRLNSGEHVPGYRLEPSSGQRYWSLSDSHAERIGIPRQISKFMTPRQAEINGFPKSLVNKHTETRTSVKLTEIDIEQINERLKKCQLKK